MENSINWEGKKNVGKVWRWLAKLSVSHIQVDQLDFLPPGCFSLRAPVAADGTGRQPTSLAGCLAREKPSPLVFDHKAGTSSKLILFFLATVASLQFQPRLTFHIPASSFILEKKKKKGNHFWNPWKFPIKNALCQSLAGLMNENFAAAAAQGFCCQILCSN